MGLLNNKKPDGLVTIKILHLRPTFPKGTKFMNNYKVKNDSKLDLKTIFYQAFTKTHPDWTILEIRLVNNN